MEASIKEKDYNEDNILIMIYENVKYFVDQNGHDLLKKCESNKGDKEIITCKIKEVHKFNKVKVLEDVFRDDIKDKQAELYLGNELILQRRTSIVTKNTINIFDYCIQPENLDKETEEECIDIEPR